MPELVQTIEQFQHIVVCDICTIDGTMCNFAHQKFPKKDVIELVQLDEATQTASEQKQLLMRMIGDITTENHNLRLMLLQEMHDRINIGSETQAAQKDDANNDQG